MRPRKTQTVAAPGSGTRSGLIRTLRAGRTIAPTLSSVYGLGRLRGQNLAAPVSDGEIASACETTSRDRSHTMCEGRTCLTWTLACESASGAHASPQRLRQSFESDRQSFFRRQLFSRCWNSGFRPNPSLGRGRYVPFSGIEKRSRNPRGTGSGTFLSMELGDWLRVVGKGHGELELKLRTCIALIGEGVAPCIEDTTFLADQAGILGHPLILWCVTSTNSRCGGELFASLIDDRVSSAPLEVVAHYV